MKKIFTFALFALSASVFAQVTSNSSCGGDRYLKQIFTDVTKTPDLVYGQGIRHCDTASIDLTMDIYEPTGDNALERPVLFVNYGGSFIGGDKSDGDVVALCTDFAKRGYVTCAINYRLLNTANLFCVLTADSAVMLDVVVKAVSDQKAAIRYIREHHAQYKIDTNFVFLSGISAGAILAAHTAYIDGLSELPSYVASTITANGGIDGNTSSNYQFNSSVQGVWSMSGGLHKAAWLDSNDPPLIAIHETSDPTVPYGHGFAQVQGQNIITIEGGSYLHTQADANSQPNVFFSITGSGHTAYIGKPFIYDSLKNEAARVFEAILCGTTQPNYVASMPINYVPSPAGIENATGTNTIFNISPNPTESNINLNIANKGKSYAVSVSDQIGRIVFESNKNTESDFQINRNILNQGMYFVTVKVDGTEKSTQRVVVY